MSYFYRKILNPFKVSCTCFYQLFFLSFFCIDSCFLSGFEYIFFLLLIKSRLKGLSFHFSAIFIKRILIGFDDKEMQSASLLDLLLELMLIMFSDVNAYSLPLWPLFCKVIIVYRMQCLRTINGLWTTNNGYLLMRIKDLFPFNTILSYSILPTM